MTQQKAILHVQAHQTIEEKRQLEESSDTESEKSKDEVHPEIQHRIHETEKHHFKTIAGKLQTQNQRMTDFLKESDKAPNSCVQKVVGAVPPDA